MIRELQESEVQGLNQLTPSEWNYDYEHFLTSFLQDDFFYAFVILEEGEIIGTGNLLIKEKIAWLANIIVSSEHRSRGLGYEMTAFLVDFSIKKGCETQLLIATKLGEAVYIKLGFRKLSAYLSFDTSNDNPYKPSRSVRKLEPSDFKSVLSLDKKANGENREHLIDKSYRTGVGYFSAEKDLMGCFLPDFGRGLILALNQEAGLELLKIKHSKKGARTLIPIENKIGLAALAKMGLAQGPMSSRMILGKENTWIPSFIYSYGSGYCG